MKNKARLKREMRQKEPDEGASSDEDGDAPLFHTGSNVTVIHMSPHEK